MLGPVTECLTGAQACQLARQNRPKRVHPVTLAGGNNTPTVARPVFRHPDSTLQHDTAHQYQRRYMPADLPLELAFSLSDTIAGPTGAGPHVPHTPILPNNQQ